jgi:hypothetical protein
MSFETERGLREKDEKKEGRRFVVLKTSSIVIYDFYGVWVCPC